MDKYRLEFTLQVQDIQPKTLRDSLAALGENLEIALLAQDISTKAQDFKIQINTKDPTLVFDACAQFGRIKSVKVDES